MAVRFAILILIFTTLYGMVVFHLYDLQLQNGKYYSAKAETQLKAAGFFEPIRGNIYFSDKKNDSVPAAINKDFPFVFAVPKELEGVEAAAKTLASIVGKPVDFLKKILGKKNDPYEPLISKATIQQIEEINKAEIGGIYINRQPARFYPLGALGSQVLGFVSANENDVRLQGQYGVERFYNTELLGKEGVVQGDAAKSSEPGKDLKLTIDRNIQARGEEILSKVIKEYNAESGSFIVQEPKTGKILAMGGLPGFDPNNYGEADIKNFLNPNVQEVYEPGSIFKVITMASGLDSGAITSTSTYYDVGSVTFNGRTIKNWDLKSHGTVSMTGVIEQSINTGAVFAERKIGHEKFYGYLKKFGFGEISGIDLPGERVGSLKPLQGKSSIDINFATASFGQGISVTPIGLINAISVVANGGVLMRPYLNAAMESKVVRRVISPKAAEEAAKMMVSAVDKALIARVQGYNVAGKTGTALVPDFEKGGYTDQVINTYVGFAPLTDPRFVILIKLVKPEGAPLAGLTVVPSFRELAEFILGYYNVKPDGLSKINE